MDHPTLKVRLLDNVQWEETIILAGTVIVAPLEFATQLIANGQAVREMTVEHKTLDDNTGRLEWR